MEIIGDDKNIRALFSELKFAEEQTAPVFAATWHRAVARREQPRAFNFALVTTTALLVLVLGSLAVWSRYSQPGAAVQIAGTIHGDSVSLAAEVKPPAPGAAQKIGPQSRPRNLATQRRALVAAANRKAAEQAKEIASWQSPTASLLSSTSDDLFRSLPQLNEKANELKSFLPNRANEKEK